MPSSRGLNRTKFDDIRKLWVDEKVLWYRGQGDARWRLTPSGWRQSYAEENEAEMRLEFESIGRQLVSSDAQRDKWAGTFSWPGTGPRDNSSSQVSGPRKQGLVGAGVGALFDQR
jgi:hypothetical protein